MREFYVKAIGQQVSDSTKPNELIDISDPNEGRWMYTTIQTVKPKDIGDGMKWIKLVQSNIPADMLEDLQRLLETFDNAEGGAYKAEILKKSWVSSSRLEQLLKTVKDLK